MINTNKEKKYIHNDLYWKSPEDKDFQVMVQEGCPLCYEKGIFRKRVSGFSRKHSGVKESFCKCVRLMDKSFPIKFIRLHPPIPKEVSGSWSKRRGL